MGVWVCGGVGGALLRRAWEAPHLALADLGLVPLQLALGVGHLVARHLQRLAGHALRRGKQGASGAGIVGQSLLLLPPLLTLNFLRFPSSSLTRASCCSLDTAWLCCHRRTSSSLRSTSSSQWRSAAATRCAASARTDSTVHTMLRP